MRLGRVRPLSEASEVSKNAPRATPRSLPARLIDCAVELIQLSRERGIRAGADRPAAGGGGTAAGSEDEDRDEQHHRDDGAEDDRGLAQMNAQFAAVT